MRHRRYARIRRVLHAVCSVALVLGLYSAGRFTAYCEYHTLIYGTGHRMVDSITNRRLIELDLGECQNELRAISESRSPKVHGNRVGQ